jgi:hypothetical protein
MNQTNEADVYRVCAGTIRRWDVFQEPAVVPIASFDDKAAALNYAMCLARGRIAWHLLLRPATAPSRNGFAKRQNAIPPPWAAARGGAEAGQYARDLPKVLHPPGGAFFIQRRKARYFQRRRGSRGIARAARAEAAQALASEQSYEPCRHRNPKVTAHTDSATTCFGLSIDTAR